MGVQDLRERTDTDRTQLRSLSRITHSMKSRAILRRGVIVGLPTLSRRTRLARRESCFTRPSRFTCRAKHAGSLRRDATTTPRYSPGGRPRREACMELRALCQSVGPRPDPILCKADLVARGLWLRHRSCSLHACTDTDHSFPYDFALAILLPLPSRLHHSSVVAVLFHGWERGPVVGESFEAVASPASWRQQ